MRMDLSNCCLNIAIKKSLLIIVSAFAGIFLVLQDPYNASTRADCLPEYPFMCSVERVDPKDLTNAYQVMDNTRWRFVSRCYEVGSYKLLPCSYITDLHVLVEDQCGELYGGACGHIIDEHKSIPDSTSIIGGLGGWGCAELQLQMYYENEIPVVNPYFWAYCGGEAMLRVQVHQVAHSLISRPFLSPPCESKESCTHSSVINVGYKDLEELPEGYPDYTRCGKIRTPECQNYEDCPNNWSAHPNVHWGRKELLKQIQTCLAPNWFKKCYRDIIAEIALVISDISLPGGGLLDMNEDWTQVPGHERHRHGTEADLAGLSVPRLPWICGPRPETTYDEDWLDKDNPLWKGDKLAENCGLTYYIKIKEDGTKQPDPGHVCLKESENVCQ